MGSRCVKFGVISLTLSYSYSPHINLKTFLFNFVFIIIFNVYLTSFYVKHFELPLCMKYNKLALPNLKIHLKVWGQLFYTFKQVYSAN